MSTKHCTSNKSEEKYSQFQIGNVLHEYIYDPSLSHCLSLLLSTMGEWAKKNHAAESKAACKAKKASTFLCPTRSAQNLLRIWPESSRWISKSLWQGLNPRLLSLQSHDMKQFTTKPNWSIYYIELFVFITIINIFLIYKEFPKYYIWQPKK